MVRISLKISLNQHNHHFSIVGIKNTLSNEVRVGMHAAMDKLRRQNQAMQISVHNIQQQKDDNKQEGIYVLDFQALPIQI